MNIIQLLPDNVANQIAAGEVIQRPSSALKELLENAIDSGANKIQVFIKGAGKTLIQVVDNGCGMNDEDARMSFERHATSKIRKADDLFSIRTMGFRGEAMASIAAISHVELKTKIKSINIGTKIIIEGSKIKLQEKCSTINGTSIEIKNLFYNVPARRNFLKSEQVELKHIIEEFQRVALANPDIYMSIHNDNKEMFHLIAGSTLRQRIVSVFGKKYNEKIVPVQEETNLVDVKGYIGKPEFSRKTRGEQYFFVNKRFIKSGYLNHAITTAFEELIPKGFHPSYFLFFEVDPKLIDINIHPTKTEIKFEDEKSIYSIILSCIRRALAQHNLTPTLDFNKDPSFENISPINRKITAPKIKIDASYNPFKQNKIGNNNINKEKKWMQLFEKKTSQNTQPKQMIIEESIEEINNHKNVYQLHEKYILSHIKSGLIIIHQQRAHERILYENFIKLKKTRDNTQKLLFPQNIELNPSDIELVKEIKSEIKLLGFDFDFINKNNIAIQGVPFDNQNENIQYLFEIFLEQYKNNAKIDKKDSAAWALAKSMSIKQGRKMNTKEMHSLINELFACETPQITEKGKPTLITITLEELAKKF